MLSHLSTVHVQKPVLHAVRTSWPFCSLLIWISRLVLLSCIDHWSLTCRLVPAFPGNNNHSMAFSSRAGEDCPYYIHISCFCRWSGCDRIKWWKRWPSVIRWQRWRYDCYYQEVIPHGFSLEQPWMHLIHTTGSPLFNSLYALVTRKEFYCTFPRLCSIEVFAP